MTFQDDLDYAKQVVVLRDAFVSGEMSNNGYIKHTDYGDSDVYKYTLVPRFVNDPVVFRVNKYGFDGVSSFQFSDGDFTFFHHNNPTKMWVPEIEDWIPKDEIECTEEFHFQQTLLYSEQTVKEMITFAHLVQNPMPEKYEYFRMNMKYFFEMQNILNRLRTRKLDASHP